MDLHTWITRQVDAAERVARDHEQPSPRWYYDALVHEIRDHDNDGTVALVHRGGTAQHMIRNDPAAVLRRCEADRRILTRHRVDPGAAATARAAACAGCGVEWVQDNCNPITDNINDCPELLDLAHAHGITPEILASLDRPQPDEPKSLAERYANGGILTPPITTSDVPEALRRARWQP
ncbi:DUF6221 family protein [Streptomyces sp. NPDC008150]|uniref:DUF6221 family protein n=1 Tax=Streptomyces sp. NPDC008150 TaxID=3364816 RepID=UPI0036EADDF8